MKHYKIGIIIPDRGDRPEFLQQCRSYVARMIMYAIEADYINLCEVTIQDYAPESAAVDITQRYKRGYNELRGKDLDCIFLIENDDWYCEDYIVQMLQAWEKANFPDMLGTDHTEYYHIKLRAHWTVKHLYRSSAMSTLIKPDLIFPWCPDHEPFTDVHLWNKVGKKSGVIFKPSKEICIGIKHGTGLCGGGSHKDRLERYVNKDHDLKWLKSHIGSDIDFYEKFGIEILN